jgi:hypothetical protein
MDSGWIAFITLAVAVTLTGFWFLWNKSPFTAVSPGGNTFSQVFGPTVGSFFQMLINLMPISLFTYGFVTDTIHQEVRGSIPSIAVLLSLLVGRVVTSIRGGLSLFQDQSESNSSVFWCSLPGLEYLENPYFPSTLFSSLTIGMYYLWWALHGGSTNQQIIIGSIVAFSVASAFVQFTLGGCSNLYYALIPIKAGGMGVILQTVLVSALLSASLWGLIQGVYPEKNPLASLGIPQSSGNKTCPGQNPPDKNGNCCPIGTMPDSGGNCSAPTPNTTCPVGQKYFEADSTGPAGCRCPNGNLPVNGSCPYSSNQSAAPSSSDQIVEARAYKNGVEVTQSIGL